MGGERDAAVELGIADMQNLSPRCAPALATRLARTQYVAAPTQGEPHGMAMLGEALYFVQGTGLYRAVDSDGDAVPEVSLVGMVSDTDKQMAVHGGRLLIFPDKLYVDGADGLLYPMELDSGAIAGMVFNDSTITLPAGRTWSALGFRAGDGLHIINADDVTPAPEGYYRIREVRGRVATLVESFSARYDSGAICRREVPDLTRVCVMGDRVYGISGADIHISAAGSAFCWAGSAGADGLGPIRLHTDTAGELTALSPWQGYMVFFKADRICRLVGNRVDSLSLVDLRAPGVPAELAGTLCEVGGALYYCSHRDVHRYSGTYPERIGVYPADKMRSFMYGNGWYRAAAGIGGSDGFGYYLSLGARSGNPANPTVIWRMFLYAPERGEWLCEDMFRAAAMLEHGGALRMQDAQGNIWMTSSAGQHFYGAATEGEDAGGVSAMVTFRPIYADGPERLRITDLYVQATAEKDAELWVDVAYADGHAESDAVKFEQAVGHFTGPMEDRMLHIPLRPQAADSVVIRLRMRGEWQITRLSWERFA